MAFGHLRAFSNLHRDKIGTILRLSWISIPQHIPHHLRRLSSSCT